MAAAVIDVIGVVSGLLGLVQFGIDNFEEEPGEGSTFKIAVGLDGTNGLYNAGGDLPDVRVWNQNGDFVGMQVDSGTVESGNLGSVHVDHENQGVYTLFSANEDAICIAWVTSTWSEDRGGNHYAVQGDMGYHCGASWYYSGMYYNPNEDQMNRVPEDQPKCFWIDKNGDRPQTGFQVRWPAFSRNEVNPTAPPEERDPKNKCNGIAFGVRNEPDPSRIALKKNNKRRNLTGASEHPKRRSRRSEAMSSRLIVGDSNGQSARFLCESENSVGPDFANTSEQLFCDMGDKKLYDFCGGSLQAGCFDVDSMILKPATNGSTAGENLSSHYKRTYASTLDWRKSKAP